MKGTILLLFFIVLVTFVVPLTQVEAQLDDSDNEGPHIEEPIMPEDDDDEKDQTEQREEETFPAKKPAHPETEDDVNL
jgi:hypothetical protein